MYGNDRGRIYRVVPENFRRPAAPQLSEASSEALVELLAHPNAWQRETAARLLVERQDRSIAPRLERVALEHESHLARIQALRLLEGLGLVRDELLLRLFADSNPRMVEQAIASSESRVAQSPAVHEGMSKLAAHADARVRFLALLVATPRPSPPAFPADRWELEAMRIAAGNDGGSVLSDMLQNPAALESNVADPKQFIADLARLAAASKDEREHAIAIDALVGSGSLGRTGLSGFLDEWSKRGESLENLQERLGESTSRELQRGLSEARLDAARRNLPETARCEAIDLVAHLPDGHVALLPIALEDPNQSVSLRAIAALAKMTTVAPWRQLLGRFSSETPVVQRAILDGIFARADRTLLLLEEIAAGRIKPSELDANRTALLLNHSDTAIKDRAAKLLADALPADREQALAEYQAVLAMKPDPSRGRGVFEKHCAICHEINGLGVRFAPDISDSREKSPAQLLTDIIQPNRAVDSNYFSYTAMTADGLVHTGVLSAETSTSVTLKQAEGKSVTLLRDEIEVLRSDGVSFMPDGMEKNIPPQDMADLISFIKNWRYLEPQSPSASP
jgi:putative heme-binding domain-containing protein